MNHIEIIAGGRPTRHELAAITIALEVVAEPSAKPDSSSWRRAGMLEGVGEPVVASRAELEGRAGWRSGTG